MAHKKAQQEIFNEIIRILKDLNHKFPNQNILRHISDATAEYGTIWGIENKEFLFALQKYEADMYMPEEDEIAKILEDGKNIGKGFKEEVDTDFSRDDLDYE